MGAVTFRAWAVGPINNRNFRTLKWRDWGDISDISPLHTQTLHMPEMGWWRKQKNGCTYPTWRLIHFGMTAWWDLGPLVARFNDDPFPKIRWDLDNTTHWQPGNLSSEKPLMTSFFGETSSFWRFTVERLTRLLVVKGAVKIPNGHAKDYPFGLRDNSMAKKCGLFDFPSK